MQKYYKAIQTKRIFSTVIQHIKTLSLSLSWTSFTVNR